MHRELGPAHRLAQHRGGRRLQLGERGARMLGLGRQRHRFLRQHDRFERALVEQPVDRARRHGSFPRRLGLGAHQPVGERRQHARPRRGHSFGRRPGEPDADPRPPLARLRVEAQRHAQHHAARRQRVVGEPLDEPHELGRERREIELSRHRLELLAAARAFRGPDAAEHPPRAERHGDDVAGRKDERLGNAVCIG